VPLILKPFNTKRLYFTQYYYKLLFLVITIPRRKQKIKYSRKFACKYLEPIGDISNSLQPLCYCRERDLVLGRRAYVCQVCQWYSQIDRKFSDIYEESRKIAEEKIKTDEIHLDEFELAEYRAEEEIDLSIDEFEEEDEEIPLKFEKRKVGKEDLEETEEYGEMECPFCGEIFEDLASHIPNCDLAPEDASIEDILPSKPKRKRRKTRATTASKKEARETIEPKTKEKCPYCGKEFVRLGRHLKSCPKKPPEEEDVEEDSE